MARFIDDLLVRWKTGGILTRLIFVNIAVFLLLRIVAIVITLSGGNADTLWIQWFELPSNVAMLVHRPWTMLTYMFAQYGIFHLLFNILWLYWFGRFFLYINTPKQLFALYVYGGLGGAALYLAAFNTLPYFADYDGLLIGSSASVLAIVVATAWRMPDFRIGLLFFGNVSLKWIAVVLVLFSLLNVSGENAGGNIAHIGGALTGAAYGYLLNSGTDITSGFNKLIDRIICYWHGIMSPKQTKTAPKFDKYRHNGNTGNGMTADEEASMDIILDKIKKSGYASLTEAERRKLFNASSKLK